jgi:hypothetical protein
MTDPGYQGQAAAAGLGVRLSGDYYETLGSRSYDPAKDISAAKTTERKVQKLQQQIASRSLPLSQGINFEKLKAQNRRYWWRCKHDCWNKSRTTSKI